MPEDTEERIDIGDEDPSIQPAVSQGNNISAQPAERRDDTRGRGGERRNGREGRNDRSGRGRRDDRPATTPAEVANPILAEEPVVESVAADVEELLLDPTAELLLEVESADYSAKKKKRRSRGGAKRTARKNAARLAAEQTGEQTGSLAAEELDEELAHETAGLLTEPVLEAVATTPETTDSLLTTAPGEETAPEPDETEALSPTSAPKPHKRGTGPTPKKSKVITKSGLIKRGKRTSLFRAADQSEVSMAAPRPSAAPIISPPIIPEILLERPAVAEAIYTSSPELTVENASTTSEPLVTPEPVTVGEPSKPTTRRSRPKAAVPTEAGASKPAKKAAKATAKPTAAAKKATVPKKTAAKKPAAKKAPTPAAPAGDSPAT